MISQRLFLALLRPKSLVRFIAQEPTFVERPEFQSLTRMYGPAVRRKGIRDGEVGLALMYPALGEHSSWPSWISARIGSHKLIGPLRPSGSPEHRCDGATVLHLIFLSQTSASSRRLM
jgi:hypothetical protein